MERLLQIVIAMSGLVISGMLGWLGLQAEETRSQQELQQTYASQTALFAQVMEMAIERCDATLLPLGNDVKNELVGLVDDINTIRTRLAGGAELVETDWQGHYDTMTGIVTECGVEAAEAPEQAEGESEAVADVRDDAVGSPIRPSPRAPAAETPAAPSKSYKGGRTWHAVLASYRVGGEESYAVERFEKLKRQIAKSGASADLKLYRTSISNHYAVALTPRDGSAEAARALVARARTEGWSTDAFAQSENTWISCSDPVGSQAALKSCG